jgi:hypothetical protein
VAWRHQLVWLAIAGCYSPGGSDPCAVTCAAGNRCPAGQECGGDNICKLMGDSDCSMTMPMPLGPPVGWWKLDEGMGTLAMDSSGNGNTGVLMNGPIWNAGHVGPGSLLFDGNMNVVAVNMGSALDDLAPLTVAAWVVPNDISPIAGSGQRRFVVKEPPYASPIKGRWTFMMTGTGGLTFTKDFSTSEVRRSTPPVLALTAWHHVAATWDGSNAAAGVHFYLDGIEVMGSSESIDGVGTKVSDAGLHISFGNEPTLMRGFAGAIDDVRIYDRVLSQEELALLATP